MNEPKTEELIAWFRGETAGFEYADHIPLSRIILLLDRLESHRRVMAKVEPRNHYHGRANRESCPGCALAAELEK